MTETETGTGPGRPAPATATGTGRGNGAGADPAGGPDGGADEAAAVARRTRSERHLRILQQVGERGAANVLDLSAWLAVSQATVRRDLRFLSEQGLLRRTHGGGVAVDNGLELPLRRKADSFRAQKRAIAQAAVRLVAEGDAVGLTGGTTTLEIARLLATRGQITVVTNAINIAAELAPQPQIRLIMTGGHARSQTYELVGPGAERALGEHHMDIAFLGVDGIGAARGCTTHDPLEAATNRAFVEGSSRAVVVADHSKVGKATLARICPIEMVTSLITDEDVDPEEAARIGARGVRVTRATET
ncbi:DeoR/GlpR family DNA-binding transcription regulator [Streptomyces sp. NPDC086091]|uniref:DeoR/GlpR family DNA-binding transcription regulator n=1 Tax=Streptomyces sp. NPDC086091 TaxID=3365751 RepID=UPI00380172D8